MRAERKNKKGITRMVMRSDSGSTGMRAEGNSLSKNIERVNEKVYLLGFMRKGRKSQKRIAKKES